MLKKISEEVLKNKDGIVNFLEELIKIPSFSTKEEKAVKLVVNKMKELNFDEAFIDDLGNAVGKVGNGKTTILYDGHIDVVGIGDESAWDLPPFEQINQGTYLRGRGAVDEKPAIACMVYAAAIAKKLNLLDDLTIYVCASVMEEDCDGYPLLHLINHEKIKPDFVVLGEPTNLQVFRGHRGRMEIKISVQGVAAHGAHCEKGTNAIYKMADIVKAIEALNKNLKHDDFLGKGSITISKIASKAPSQCSVSDYCEIYLDRRLTKGETKETALAELAYICPSDVKIELLNYRAKSWKGFEAEQEAFFPTWVLPENHILVQTGLECAEKITQKKHKASRWTFSTNGVATMGRLGIPTIGFAPALEDLAHSTQEVVSMDDLITASNFYTFFPILFKKKLYFD